MANPRTISVIIPTYNAAKTLESCLQSLTLQTTRAQEVWVVDDSSTDSTVEIAKKFPFVSLLHQNHQGPAIARNTAASHAHSDILVFIDADMKCHPNTLEKLTAPIRDGSCRGTFIKTEYVKNWHNMWAKCWNWEYTKQRSRLRIPPNHPIEAPVFRAITKSEFLKVHGFTSSGYNDDWSLSKKLNYKAVAAPGAIVYHENPGSLWAVWHQAQWVAKRSYKAGEVGRVIALVRTTAPISIFFALVGAMRSQLTWYIPFKLIYDTAVAYGIISYWISGHHEK